MIIQSGLRLKGLKLTYLIKSLGAACRDAVNFDANLSADFERRWQKGKHWGSLTGRQINYMQDFF